MSVSLSGSSPTALTAGILLLSRARSFGQRFPVEIVGDPADIATLRGPALVHSPVLASCGVGRRLGAGATVIVPGPASAPLALSFGADGVGGWFEVDRAGDGQHPATQAFVRLCRAREPVRRELGRRARRVFTAFGMAPEPAVLDVLFGAPSSPLVRISLGLRAGRALANAPAIPLHQYLGPTPDELPDPLPAAPAPAEIGARLADGRMDPLFARFPGGGGRAAQDWLEDALALGDDPDVRALTSALAELGGHLASLPREAMLPPLDAAQDAVAVALGRALAAQPEDGEVNANHTLVETFRFLGGRFCESARNPVRLEGPPPPEGHLARWDWFCAATRRAADEADALWRRVVDPPQ